VLKGFVCDDVILPSLATPLWLAISLLLRWQLSLHQQFLAFQTRLRYSVGPKYGRSNEAVEEITTFVSGNSC
jgi:hypothetical protein